MSFTLKIHACQKLTKRQLDKTHILCYDKNMEIEEYKKYSFIANVSNEEIKDLLNSIGYKLDYRMVDESDGMRQTIERIYDSRNRKVTVQVCVKNIEQENIYNTVAFRAGLHNIFSSNRFNTSIIAIDDYTIYDMFNIYEQKYDKNMQKSFYNFMKNKFGKRYEIAYKKYATRYANYRKNEEKNDLIK